MFEVPAGGRRYRALNPWAPEDGHLLELINQGQFTLNGFRNRDIRQAYFTSRCDDQELKRRMGWIGRRLRLFRAHGLIAKVSGTHRYVVTDKGRISITALLAVATALLPALLGYQFVYLARPRA